MDLGPIAFDPEARTPNGKIDVKGHGAVSAQWDSADEGHVTADIARSIDLEAGAPQMSLIINSGWDYFFTADRDGVFNLDYGFKGDGQLDGLGAWFFELKSAVDTRHFDEFQDRDLEQVFDGRLQHLAFTLKAGRTYDISLFGGGQNRPADGKHLAGGYQATFDWRIIPNAVSAVPEPASWCLMIIGFGVAGGGMRRRRRAGPRLQRQAGPKA